MAVAEHKGTTPRYFTLSQAAARIDHGEFRIDLEDERLPAWDRDNRIECEQLARFPYRRAYTQPGASEADRDAIDAIAGGAPIPGKTWRHWFQDGVVNFEKDEIIRAYIDRVVVFRPLLRSADVLALMSPDLPTQTITTAHQAAAKTPTVVWITAEAGRLKKAGKIRDDISITDLAKLFAGQMEKAEKTDKSLRPVGWGHIKNKLPDWGLWPVSLIKLPD